MSLIEGIGDEVTHFFIGIFTILIVYIAWWSTNISEQRHFRTVLLLDRRRRTARSILRVRLPRRLSNHTEAVTISEGSSTINTSTLSPESTSSSTSAEATQPGSEQIGQNKSPSTSSNPEVLEETVSEHLENSELRIVNSNSSENLEETEERGIIETMDAETQNVVRLRRLARFERGAIPESMASDAGTSKTQSEGSHIINSIEVAESSSSISESKDNNDSFNPITSTEKHENQSVGHRKKEEDPLSITIKLKFINDDIKIVDGKLNELLGDFRRRHFDRELNTNKTVKLIFNGQVLKQDRHTLQNCGLFDNCVVHCLIHQKRPSSSDEQSQEAGNTQNTDFFRENPFVGITNVNNNNQGIDWDLGNFLFALISFILLAAWYFRYIYAHLYTVTATIGLIIITGIFSIVVLGMYFPDNEQIPHPNTRIRIARAERIELRQQ